MNDNLPPGMNHAPGDGPEAEAWSYYWEHINRQKGVYCEVFECDRTILSNEMLFDLYELIPKYQKAIDKDFEEWTIEQEHPWEDEL